MKKENFILTEQGLKWVKDMPDQSEERNEFALIEETRAAICSAIKVQNELNVRNAIFKLNIKEPHFKIGEIYSLECEVKIKVDCNDKKCNGECLAILSTGCESMEKLAFVSQIKQEKEDDSHMLFHECPNCNWRFNCGNNPCSCCQANKEEETKEIDMINLLERASMLIGNPWTNISLSADFACEDWHKDYEKFTLLKQVKLLTDSDNTPVSSPQLEDKDIQNKIWEEMDADMDDCGMAQGEIVSNINHWKSKYTITRK